MMSSLKQPTNISEHLNAHSSGYFKCSVCDREFEVKHNLTKHFLNVHCDTRLHACEKCGRRFLMEASLRRHSRTHQEVKCRSHEIGENFTCEKTCEEKQEFQKPSFQIHNELPTSHPCGKCGKNFNDKLSLQRHMGVHSQECQRLYACKKCNQTFKYKHSCVRHSMKCRNLMKTFTCHHCNQGFTRKFSIRKHIMRAHSQDGCLYACKVCNRTFKYKRSSERHSITCKKLTKPFICHLCDRRFRRKFTIRRHIIDVHSREGLPFACNQCPKKFKQRSDLQRHSLTDCRNLIQLYFTCNQCNKKFMSESNLKRHIMGAHSCGKCLCDIDKSRREDNNYLSITDEDQSKRSSVELSSPYSRKDESGFVYEPKESDLSHFSSDDDPKFEKNSSKYSTPPESTNEYHYNTCPGCCESFESYDMLIRHVQLCAEYDSILNREKERQGDELFEKQFWCGVCYLSFISLRTFVSHLKLGHRVTFLYHKCDDSC